MNSNLNLFIYWVVSILVGFAVAVWAWIEGDFFRAGFYGLGVVFFGVLTILSGWESLKRGDRDKTNYLLDGNPRRRLALILWRGFWGLFLLVQSVFVVIRIVIGLPLYVVLGGLWWMIISGVFLLFAPIYLYELNRTSYPRWLKKWLMKRRYVFVTIHAAHKPYRLKTVDHDPQHIRDMLSCPSCRFYQEEDAQRGRPWCNAPYPPEIENNYCITFEPNK
ncbi:hypothetical protein ACFLXH_06650 [Chloroflexota bacterium]